MTEAAGTRATPPAQLLAIFDEKKSATNAPSATSAKSCRRDWRYRPLRSRFDKHADAPRLFKNRCP
jgi:hypothetical protein